MSDKVLIKYCEDARQIVEKLQATPANSDEFVHLTEKLYVAGKYISSNRNKQHEQKK